MKKLILLIGAPGSGKTTDAVNIAKNHPEITALSTGKLLEEEIQKGTAVGNIINDYLSKGELVPTAIVIDVIVDAVKNAPTDIVLLDGFPRKEKQMKIFADFLFNHDEIDLDSVIEIRVSDEVAKERSLDSGDTVEVFENKLKTYKSTISDIEEFYNQKGLLKVIDGEQEQEKVIKEIDDFLKSHIALK